MLFGCVVPILQVEGRVWDANVVVRPQLYDEVLTLVDAARDAAALQPDGSDLPPAKCWQLVEVVRGWGMYYEHLTCSYVQEANPSGVWVSGRGGGGAGRRVGRRSSTGAARGTADRCAPSVTL
jgi:hypothetical protein